MMLKILFSPSEGKVKGGTIDTPLNLFGATDARNSILQAYNSIIQSGDETQVKELFGLKKFTECQEYIEDIFHAPLMEALKRYQGVAYDYLAFDTLSKDAQEYLKKNTLIFSNLYGPILGGDKIANYKVKQGNAIGAIAPEKFYKERFSYQIDLFLHDNDILDLRAGYYDKFYTITKPYTTLKFLKDGKSVSHWAKAYRGVVLKEIARNSIKSLEEFSKLKIDGLTLKDTQTTKMKTEMIYTIEN